MDTCNSQEKEIDDKGKTVNLVIEVSPNSNSKKDLASSKNRNTSSSSSSTSSKKKNRKGGLSMFLSGALDDTPKIVAPLPPPSPKNEGPAWGGTSISKGPSPTSLREIQDEQEKTMGSKPMSIAKKKDQLEVVDVKTSGKLSLSSFLPSNSNSNPMGPNLTPHMPDVEKSTPPWVSVSSGTPPLGIGIGSRPSLRGIQLQEV